MFELRNPTEKKLVFAVMCPGKSRVETISGETDWWSSLAGLGASHFYVHNYRNPDIPEPSDLLSFGIETGRLEWVLPNVRFGGFDVSGALVVAEKKGGELRYGYCEPDTGRLKGPYPEPAFPEAEKWQEPVRYRAGAEYYELMAGFVRKSTGLIPAGSIEYLDSADKMIFSFYLYENDSLVQYVAIVNRLREVEYLEPIEKNLEKEGKNVLMVKEGWLYFVKERRSFVGINLMV